MSDLIRREDAIRTAMSIVSILAKTYTSDAQSIYAFLSHTQECFERIMSADAVSVIRCKDCKYGEYRADYDDYECNASGCGLVYDAEYFCAEGEREDER